MWACLVFFFFFCKDSRSPSAGHTHQRAAPHTRVSTCSQPLCPTLLSPGHPCSQTLSLLRASKCWTRATWAIYFITWYALPVEKLRWRGLERKTCCKEAWPQLLQRMDDSEKWGSLQWMWHGDFSRKWTLAPECNKAHLMFLTTTVRWWNCWLIF